MTNISDEKDLLQLQLENQRLRAILNVAKDVALYRTIDSLLHYLLITVKEFLDADRCSLFIVDHQKKELWSKIAQGIDKEQEIRFPIGAGIAGMVAHSGETIFIDNAYNDPRFNQEIDKITGYRTSSILCAPLVNFEGKIVGVVEALNKFGDNPFTSEDASIISAMGIYASAAIENVLHHEEIRRLFDGFIKASVVAIESRDPTTSGHSERVAKLCVALAEEVNATDTGTYKNVFFNTQSLKEIRYSALLHDFGKVGVREPVLIKAKKLYPQDLELLSCRLTLIQQNLLFRKEMASRAKDKQYFEQELNKLLAWKDLILQYNEPSVLESAGLERLEEMLKISYTDITGTPVPLLTNAEYANLTIRKGSLNANERKEIEDHVVHTYRFLSQIPWTSELKNVPDISYGHHEKLDGSGYPNGMKSNEIRPQTRIMTIADIYDALTARDRPYKKAIPHEKALAILTIDAEKGAIDHELFEIFCKKEVHRAVEI